MNGPTRLFYTHGITGFQSTTERGRGRGYPISPGSVGTRDFGLICDWLDGSA